MTSYGDGSRQMLICVDPPRDPDRRSIVLAVLSVQRGTTKLRSGHQCIRHYRSIDSIGSARLSIVFLTRAPGLMGRRLKPEWATDAFNEHWKLSEAEFNDAASAPCKGWSGASASCPSADSRAIWRMSRRSPSDVPEPDCWRRRGCVQGEIGRRHLTIDNPGPLFCNTAGLAGLSATGQSVPE